MKRMAVLLAVAVVLLLLAAGSILFLVNPNRFRPRLEAELSKSLGRAVTIGDLKLAILSGGVSASNISIADEQGYSTAPFLRAQSLTMSVELRPLIFARQLIVSRLRIDQPEIDVFQSPAGDWNFASLGAHTSEPAARMPALAVKLIEITNGRLSVAQLQGGSRATWLDHVNIEARDFSTAQEFPFTFSANLAGADMRLDGTVGPIRAGDLSETPAKINVKLARLDLASIVGGSTFSGRLSLDGTGTTEGRNLHLKGHVQAERLKLARNGIPAREPVAFDFDIDHDTRRRSGVLHLGQLHLGSAVAALTGTYARQSQAMVVNMNLNGARMPVPQLAAMLPPLGIALPAGSSLQGGTANAKLAFMGPVDALVTSGTVGLSDSKLAGFNLGANIFTIARLAGVHAGPDTEIESFEASFKVAPEGSTAQDVKLVAPAVGELVGAGTISPQQALDFKMVATIHTSGGVLEALGHKGDARVPFLVAGTAASPVFRPNVDAIAAEQIRNNLGKAAGAILTGLFGKKK